MRNIDPKLERGSWTHLRNVPMLRVSLVVALILLPTRVASTPANDNLPDAEAGVAAPARFPEDFSCNQFPVLTKNDRQVWLVLFKKLHCPHCMTLDWDWQMTIADLLAAPHTRVAEVQMNQCPGIAKSFRVVEAPTTILINGARSDIYTGARTTQGFVGAVQRSIAKWKVPMTYHLDRSRPVHMLSSTTVDPVLESTIHLPWIIQVSARWPPSPALLDPRLASLGVHSAFALHSDTKLMSMLSLKSKPAYYWLPPSLNMSLNLGLDSDPATFTASPFSNLQMAPVATVAAAFVPCSEYEVNVRMLNHRSSPSLHGDIIGQWTARTLFLGTCASDTSVDSSCPWLMTCTNASPSFATRVGEDGSVRIRPSTVREKQEITLIPTRRRRLADQIVEWAQLALALPYHQGGD